MKILPLGDRIIVKRDEEEYSSSGGIVIPDSAREKPLRGRVTAVGPGCWLDNGTRRIPDVSESDLVLFSKYSGNEITLDKEKFLVLREEDIMGIIEL